MMNVVNVMRVAPALACAAILATAAAGDPLSWSISSDWSDVNNPNGPWSLRIGDGAPLRGHSTWNGQLVWGGIPCGWFRSDGSEGGPHCWQAGDVVTHTCNSGDPDAAMVIRWVSPVNGVVDVSGSLWWGCVPDQFFRANDWAVTFNGVRLTGGVGTIGSGCGCGRDNPIPFEGGSGGPRALKNLPVRFGDEIQLVVSRNANSYQGWGSFTGVTFEIGPACAADFNGDGMLDFFDYLDFVNAFEEGC